MFVKSVAAIPFCTDTLVLCKILIAYSVLFKRNFTTIIREGDKKGKIGREGQLLHACNNTSSVFAHNRRHDSMMMMMTVT